MLREQNKIEIVKFSLSTFACMCITLERLYDVKSTLCQTIVSTMWNGRDE